MALETDKRTEEFSMRIPEITKIELNKLTKHQKSKLIENILITMAQSIHNAKFEPGKYLIEDFEDNQCKQCQTK